MNNLFRKRLFWLILFIVFNLFMLIGVKENISFFTKAIVQSSNGIRMVVGTSTKMLSNALKGLQSYRTLKRENKNLHAAIEKYQMHYKSIDAILFENQKLRELLQFRYSVEYDLQPAHIITSAIQEGKHEFIIDAGSRSGVREGMIICAIANQRLVLVGMVSQVRANNANFTSIQQNNFSLPIITNQSKQIGILSGEGAFQNRLKVIFDDIYESKNIIVGEEVSIQKYSSKFPQGLPIGAISNITTNVEDSLLVATVEPLIYANNLALVLVLIPKETNE